MFNTRKITSALIAATIGFGVLSAGSGAAFAAGGSSAGNMTVEVRMGDHGRERMRRDHSPRREMHRGHFQRHGIRRGRSPRICTDGEAIHKARSLGVRRTHVAWANRKVVKVNGRKFGRPISLTIGRAPFCPILRF